MIMSRLIIFLLVVFTQVDSFAQVRSRKSKLGDIGAVVSGEDDFPLRKSKAFEVGQRVFGVDDRLNPKTEQYFRGTLATKSPADFQVGDWGYTSHMFSVLSVVSATEFLAVPIENPSEGRVHSVILIRGLPTEKLSDGEEVVIAQPFAIPETFDYETVAGGKKTVLVLDHKKFDDMLKEQQEAEERALIRTWVIAEKEVVAKFIGTEKSIAELEVQSDGSIIEVAVSTLSKEDQKWIREELKKRKKPIKGPFLNSSKQGTAEKTKAPN